MAMYNSCAAKEDMTKYVHEKHKKGCKRCNSLLNEVDDDFLLHTGTPRVYRDGFFV